MNREEWKAKGTEASNNLDRIADSYGDTLWEKLKASRYTWLIVGVVLTLSAYGAWRVWKLFA
jgi:hypothetical protein